MPFPALTPTQPDEGFLNKSLLDQLDAQADAEPATNPPDDDDDRTNNTISYHTTSDNKMPFYPRASFTAFPNATRLPQRPPYREPPSTTAHQFYPDSYSTLTSPVLQPFDPRASFDFKPTYPLDFPPPQQQTQQQPQPQQKLNGYAPPYINGSGTMHSQTPYGPHVPMNGAGALPPPGMMSSISGMQEDISTIFVVGFPDDMQEREFQNMFTFSPGFEAATLKIPNKEYTAYGLPPLSSASQTPGQRGGYSNNSNVYSGSNDPYNLVTVNQGGVVVDAGRDGISSWPAAPAPPQSDSGDPTGAASQPTPQPSQSQFALGGVGAGANPGPPRKQIIGFAKFRTREEALGARDVLQGRRVDIDKGAVLKAEMAKKNLHTKRGVGPVGGAGGAGGMGVGGMGGMNGAINGMNGLNGALGAGSGMIGEMYADALGGPRERESSAMGGIGMPAREPGALNGASGNLNSNPNNNANINGSALTNGKMAQWRNEMQLALALDEEDQQQQAAALHDERERRHQGVLSAMGLRGARERAEEERLRGERERDAAGMGMEGERARRRERERRAFEAFSISRDSQIPPTQQQREEGRGYAQGPWDGVRLGGGVQSRSRRSSSPETTPNGSAYALANGVPFSGEAPRAFSSPPPGEFAPHHGLPPAHYVPLGYAQQQVGQYPSPFMQQDQQQQPAGYEYLQHRQGRSESSGSERSTSDPERVPTTRAAVRNASSTTSLNGTGTPNVPIAIPGGNSGNNSGGSSGGSPQLASPSSSGTGRAVDQNPPINTLYVGNLPALPAAGGAGLTMEHLEAALREVFSACAGFRQMSVRPSPKGNGGPMCFVEFEDVNFATKTLNELYGNTLDGLIKGDGLRLSYSKNPFGVRTPTSATGIGASLQQQQQGLAAAEAAFHQRLMSPPPPQEPSHVASAQAFPAPRFFNAAPEGAWSRRWETVGVPRAVAAPVSSAVNGTGSTFSPFSHSPTPIEPAAEGEAQ